MSIDYEKEYDNRGRVPESAAIMQRWSAAARSACASTNATLDLRYGASERHRYDLFASGQADAPLAVYIHGGYWQRGDRKDYAFIAPALNARGIDVAIPSYSLCPAVPISTIITEMRELLLTLWKAKKRRAAIVGHSAGGHLAAAMLATNWQSIADAPSDLVRGAYAISGVFDLPPLINTSLNAALQLNADAARAASPLFWQPPPSSAHMIAAVGGLESAEFLRQSLDLAECWSRAGVKAECVVVPATNHFTIVDELTRVDSAIVARVIGLAAISQYD